MKYLLTLSFIVLLACQPVHAGSNSAKIHSITDVEKTRVYRTRSFKEVCTENRETKDHTANTLKRAGLGAILGNNLIEGDNNALFGAVVGAMLGHHQSSKNSPKGFQCTDVLVPIDKEERVYSHSILDITIDGVRQQIKFYKANR